MNGDKIIVKISEDRSKAFVILAAPSDSDETLSTQHLTEALRASGVIHGIDESTLHEIIQDPQYGKAELVASATPPEKGPDAAISYLFPLTSEAKPKQRPDGSVDFKELDIIKNVTAGEPLCRKIPAQEGPPGTDVTGGIIAPLTGNDIPLPKGQNTKESENGLELLAAIDGQVDLVNLKVTVTNTFTIAENIDYNTGNIDFVGNVSVGGDVCASFIVRAAGNIFIKGGVDGGIIEAGGNVTIISGFNGQSSGKITCGGNLQCKYLQNANVEVNGDLETTSCVNSIVAVGGKAKFSGSQAMLLASRITAGQSLEAYNVGSIGSTTGNIIEVGANPALNKQAAQNAAETAQHNKNIENLNKIITLYKQLEAQDRLPGEKKEELIKLTATFREATQRREELNAESQIIAQKKQKLGYGSIKVIGTAYAGTQLIIGSESKLLTTDETFTLFTRTQEGITTSPAQ